MGICVVRLTTKFKIKYDTSLAYNIYTVLCAVKFRTMKIKIDAVDGISLANQLQIVQDYINQESKDGEPIQTKKGFGTKIESCGRRYHVSCHKANTMWVFSIWWGV